jgi:DNA polymerase-3 subunit epsilon
VQLSDATFVVTDTETTGAKAGRDRVMEIGAVKVVGGEIVDTYQQLVNPERSIPRRITQITGIDTPMVIDQPTMDAVMPGYLDFLGDAVFVAHNLSFDERFLNSELTRLGRPALANDTLCTLRLARRLLPGLKSKGLTRLAQFYGVRVQGRHRALGDAEATGVILGHFLRQLAFEHEVETLDELLSFQHKKYRQVRTTPKHLKKLRETVLPELPDAPGVYFLENGKGSTLYIGKAKCLSDRVRSYFTAVESHAPRRRKLMNKVRQVRWTTTDTEVEALLLESRLIKAHKPSYNRAQRRYKNRPFLRLDTTERFPRLGWRHTVDDDGAEYYGPLRSWKVAEQVADLVSRFYRLRTCEDTRLRLGRRCLYADLDRCTAPCENRDAAAYDAAVAEVRAFLTGRDRALLDHLEARMRHAAEQLDFETAAEVRDALDVLRPMQRKQAAIAAPVRERHAVLVLPDAPRALTQCIAVRHGRLAGTLLLPDAAPADAAAADAPNADAPARLTDWLATHFVTEEDAGAYSKEAIDGIRLLAQWMYVHRDDLAVVPCPEAVRTGRADVRAALDAFATAVAAARR